jgi:hypothetical protein
VSAAAKPPCACQVREPCECARFLPRYSVAANERETCLACGHHIACHRPEAVRESRRDRMQRLAEEILDKASLTTDGILKETELK